MNKSLYEFGQEMAHIMPVFMKEILRRQAKALSAGNITVPQMLILNILKQESHLMMSKIARNLGVTTSAATGLVSRMIKAGLIKRVTDEKDRRVIYIEMSKKGKAIIDNIQKVRYRMMMNMFSKLTTLERKRYLDTVKKLCRVLKEGHK